MAIMKCPECGKEISDKAEYCPHCGYPISINNGNNSRRLNLKGKEKEVVVVKEKSSGCFGCLITLIVIIILGKVADAIFVPSNSDNHVKTETFTVPETCEHVTIEQMRDDLKSNEIRAQKKYKDQWFEISGYLGDMDSDGDYFYITDFYFMIAYTIKCNVRPEMKSTIVNKLMKKEKYKAITVKGKVTDMGEIMGYEVTAVDIK